jgi:ferredoxin-NADP reductase
MGHRYENGRRYHAFRAGQYIIVGFYSGKEIARPTVNL